jgi:hypothetical protein
MVNSPSIWGKSPKEQLHVPQVKSENKKKSFRNNELQIFISTVRYGTLPAVGMLVEHKLNTLEEHKHDKHTRI